MLDDYLDEQLIILTEYLLNNPALNKNKHYHFHEVIDLPDQFTIESYALFSIMSSAFSLNKEKQQKFLETHPRTNKYLSTLGPNRLQYAIILFDLLRKIDSLVVNIIKQKVSKMEDMIELMSIYESHTEFRYRKGMFLGAPDWIKAKIILFDSDTKISKLRYSE